MPAPAAALAFIDTSLRDGHQSLLATRMSGRQCNAVLPRLMDVGYGVMELWGGAVLDASLRFTHEDPFERLITLRRLLDQAERPIQIRSLCRGQNLFGYTPYPDNVVCEFMKEAVRLGSGPSSLEAGGSDAPAASGAMRNKPIGPTSHRIRVFDALNDARNLTTAVMATKTFNGEVEAAISYTTSPVHDVPYFIRFAGQCMDLGADRLAIKDMAGLLAPDVAFELIEGLQHAYPGVPITLHSHCTTGLASATYVVGMLCGVESLDTGHGPMAGGTAQPPVELMQWFADALGLETNVDPAAFPAADAALRAARAELAEHDRGGDGSSGPWPAEPTAEHRRVIDEAIRLLKTREPGACDQAATLIETRLMEPMGYPPADRSQLESQIPGGMISNLQSQLSDMGKLDSLPAVLEEVPRVRKAAGYVPLVTPTSQIVGSQAAFNVILGTPYKQVSVPFRDLVTGRYGKLPGPVDTAVLAKVSGDQEPYSGRAADLAGEIDLPAVYASNGKLIRSRRDLLLLLLFPMPAKQYLSQRAEG